MPANRSLTHPAQRHSIHDAAADTKPDYPTRKLVHHNQNPMCCQCRRFASEQIAAPQTILHVADERKPGRKAGGTARRRSGAKALAICWAMRGQPQFGLRLFHCDDGVDEVYVRSLRARADARAGWQTTARYFRFLSTLWKCSRVEGFKTTALRRTRARRMKRVHNRDDPIAGAQLLGPVRNSAINAGVGRSRWHQPTPHWRGCGKDSIPDSRVHRCESGRSGAQFRQHHSSCSADQPQ